VGPPQHDEPAFTPTIYWTIRHYAYTGEATGTPPYHLHQGRTIDYRDQNVLDYRAESGSDSYIANGRERKLWTGGGPGGAAVSSAALHLGHIPLNSQQI
jgi:hypothetical protein